MMKIPETNIVLETMPKRALNYYKHLKIVLFWTSVVKFSFLGLSTMLAAAAYFKRADLDPIRLQAVFVVSLMLFIIFLFWQIFQKFFLKQINDRRVNVFENRLEIFQADNEGEKHSINFSDIQKVDWGLFSVFGVFFIATNDRIYRFSSFLHRAEYILEAIEEARPELFTEIGFEDMRNSVLAADHRLSRVHDMFFGRYKFVNVFCYFLLPAIGCGLIIWQQLARTQVYFMPEYLWTLVNMVIAAAIIVGALHFIIAEFVLDKDLQARLKEDFNDKGRDLDYEEGVFAKSNPAKIFAIALSFYTILAHDMNQFTNAQINNSSADLNILKNDSYIVDRRYNCVSCVYELKKDNDIVFIHEDQLYYGRVLSPNDRQPASVNNAEQVEVKINDQGETLKVPFSRILGKVIRD